MAYSLPRVELPTKFRQLEEDCPWEPDDLVRHTATGENGCQAGVLSNEK